MMMDGNLVQVDDGLRLATAGIAMGVAPKVTLLQGEPPSSRHGLIALCRDGSSFFFRSETRAEELQGR
jgi:hypothetical protein